MSKPIFKEDHESFGLNDEVEYKGNRCHIIYVKHLSNGLTQFDLEGDEFIYEGVPNWCCKKPKYKEKELVPSLSIFQKIKTALFG